MGRNSLKWKDFDLELSLCRVVVDHVTRLDLVTYPFSMSALVLIPVSFCRDVDSQHSLFEAAA